MTERSIPINPFYLPKEEQIRYFEEFRGISNQDQGTIPYWGVELFLSFVEAGKIGLGTIIRIANTNIPSREEHYVLIEDGLQHIDGEIFNPEKILKRDSIWNIEGFEFIAIQQLRLLPRE